MSPTTPPTIIAMKTNIATLMDSSPRMTEDGKDDSETDPHCVRGAEVDSHLHGLRQANHTEDQYDDALHVPEEVGKRVGVVESDGPSNLQDAS